MSSKGASNDVGRVADISNIKTQYQQAFRSHGRTPASVLCPKGRQDSRFAALLAPCQVQGRRLLDFGCGLGHLCEYLEAQKIQCDYVGVDIVEEFIDSNRRRFPGQTFEKINDIDDVAGRYDVILASGVFNIKYIQDEADNAAFVQSLLSRLFEKADHALTVDFMTSHVDFRQDQAFHPDPATMANFFGSMLSRRFQINHGYMPYEYCVTAFKAIEIERARGTYVS